MLLFYLGAYLDDGKEKRLPQKVQQKQDPMETSKDLKLIGEQEGTAGHQAKTADPVYDKKIEGIVQKRAMYLNSSFCALNQLTSSIHVIYIAENRA